MRVGFDDQALLAQRRGGVSRYVLSLVEAFRQAPELGVEPVPAWRYTTNEHALATGAARGIGLFDRHGSSFDPVGAGACYLLNTRARRSAARADLVHYTFYHPRFLPRVKQRPMVVTVYDMIPELFPELFQRNPHLAKAEYVRRCDLVLCISESARDDLLKVYGPLEAPIAVTPLGVDPRFRPGAAPLAGLPRRYLLYVGRRDGYKDFAVVTAALAQMSGRIPLVTVGGGSLTDLEREALAGQGLDGWVIQRNLPESALPSVYANALAFIFPSRYEGFGLPTLEAMACGTPTVLAAASSLPEVGGDAAWYFPPGDAAALAARLEHLIGDSVVSADLGERGLVRAQAFNWRRTAELTAQAYGQLVPATA